MRGNKGKAIVFPPTDADTTTSCEWEIHLPLQISKEYPSWCSNISVMCPYLLIGICFATSTSAKAMFLCLV